MGKRELVALLNLSFWCLKMVEWLFLAVPWGCLQFVIVVFSDQTHYFFLNLFDQLPLILTALFHADLINVGYLMVCVLIRS